MDSNHQAGTFFEIRPVVENSPLSNGHVEYLGSPQRHNFLPVSDQPLSQLQTTSVLDGYYSLVSYTLDPAMPLGIDQSEQERNRIATFWKQLETETLTLHHVRSLPTSKSVDTDLGPVQLVQVPFLTVYQLKN
mmetsp:Transcript_4030/g.6200  ORF Transcript_4030/g.6200 Transcript_4030/m.6200 type:complete len:133 (+) Transcript_4030:1459-1857(+)